MRTITKIVSSSILAILIIIIVSIFGFYFWLNQRLYKVIDKETYDYLVETIKTSPDLPEKFYSIYGQLTNYDEESTTKRFIFYKTAGLLSFDNFREIKHPCPCVNANYGIEYHTFDTWTVGLALDKDVTPKKCLDFYLSKLDFSFSVKGIQNASIFYFHKNMNELTDDEMLELSIMAINPYTFNKLRQPERLKSKMIELKSKIKNAENK